MWAKDSGVVVGGSATGFYYYPSSGAGGMRFMSTTLLNQSITSSITATKEYARFELIG
ncbi:MAG TPA: hypothetical protein VFD03_11930 [Clostridia bacterium]|nr:hypothetical protein [Clostridia bacterium]